MTQLFFHRYPRSFKWLTRAFGPTILVIILLHLDFNNLLKSIRQAEIMPLVIAYFMLLPAVFLRSARWRVLLVSQKMYLGRWEAFTVYAFSIFAGTLTPGRIGEFVKAIHLKKKGKSFGEALSSVFLDRILDIFILLFFACGSLSFLNFDESEYSLTTVFILLGIFFGSVALWFFTRGNGYALFFRFLGGVVPRRIRDRLLSEYQAFCKGFQLIRPRTFVLAMVLSTFAWGMNYYAVYLCGRALGFEITFFQMVSIAAVCALVSLLPVSVMGLGTRDAALILMLGKYGVTETGSVAFSTLILSMLIFNAILCSFSLLTQAGKFDFHAQVSETIK